MEIVHQKADHTRETGVEILRIIAMIMILILHYLLFGGVLSSVQERSGNYYIAWTLEAFSYGAVNIYVFISGYFLCKSSLKVKKLILLISQMVFYSVTIYFIFCIAGKETFNLKSFVVQYLFPVIHGEFWFGTLYIALYLLSPFLNILLKAMNYMQHLSLCGVLFLMLSIIPTIIPFAGNTIGTNEGYSLIWFIFLYLTSALIRMYSLTAKKRILALGYIVLSLMVALSKFIPGIGLWNFYRYTSILAFVASLCLFMLFLQIDVRKYWPKRFICSIASCTFGVFLIHSQYNIRDHWLWNSVVKASSSVNLPPLLFFLNIAVWVFVIYIVCTLLEYLRKLLFYPIEHSRLLNDICKQHDQILGKAIEWK